MFRRGPVPHAAVPWKGKKKSDRSLHVFINDNGDIGVQIFRDDVSWLEAKEYARQLAGLPAWQPRCRKPKARPAVPCAIRNHFFGETLAVCRYRRSISVDQFALLINDLRLRGDTKDAIKYVREFAMPMAELDRCMGIAPRHYTADQRATILELPYTERQQLELRRTGSIDVDKAGRERARRDRYNAKRRAARAAARLSGVNRKPSLEVVVEERKQGDTTYSTEVVETEITAAAERITSKTRNGPNVTEARQHLRGPGRGRSTNVQASSTRRDVCGQDHGADIAPARRRASPGRTHDPDGNREQQTRVDRAGPSSGVGHPFRASELVLRRGVVRGHRHDRPRWCLRGGKGQPTGRITPGWCGSHVVFKAKRQIRD